jgi:hypothetical protein
VVPITGLPSTELDQLGRASLWRMRRDPIRRSNDSGVSQSPRSWSQRTTGVLLCDLEQRTLGGYPIASGVPLWAEFALVEDLVAEVISDELPRH